MNPGFYPTLLEMHAVHSGRCCAAVRLVLAFQEILDVLVLSCSIQVEKWPISQSHILAVKISIEACDRDGV